MTLEPETVVVIPAHNEFAALTRCVESVRTAASTAAARTAVVVVLDACDDDSATLAGRFGPDVHFVDVYERNVGAARAAGFRYAAATFGAAGRSSWYATTDADTEVDSDWLARQLAVDADMVLGLVRVGVWRHHSPAVASAYEARYRADGLRQRHIHGANMGFDARAYWAVGGFPALASGEDVELVRRFEANGYRVHRDDQLWVSTSDRRHGRAPGGFAEHLGDIADQLSPHEQTGEAS